MIKKVAEAQALRFAFPEMFAGTWHEAENWSNANSKPERKVKIKVSKPAPVEPEPVEDAEFEEVKSEANDRVLKGLAAIKDIYIELDEEDQAGFTFECNDLFGKDFPDETSSIEEITTLYKLAAKIREQK